MTLLTLPEAVEVVEVVQRQIGHKLAFVVVGKEVKTVVEELLIGHRVVSVALLVVAALEELP